MGSNPKSGVSSTFVHATRRHQHDQRQAPWPGTARCPSGPTRRPVTRRHERCGGHSKSAQACCFASLENHPDYSITRHGDLFFKATTQEADGGAVRCCLRVQGEALVVQIRKQSPLPHQQSRAFRWGILPLPLSLIVRDAGEILANRTFKGDEKRTEPTQNRPR